MKKKIVALLYVASVAVLGTAATWSVADPAYACPETMRIFTYYADASKTGGWCGGGLTTCRTGHFEMCFGVQTPYYNIDEIDCDGCGLDCDGGGW